MYTLVLAFIFNFESSESAFDKLGVAQYAVIVHAAFSFSQDRIIVINITQIPGSDASYCMSCRQRALQVRHNL